MTNNSQHHWHLLYGFCHFALVFCSVTRLHIHWLCTLSPTTIYSIFFIHFHFFQFPSSHSLSIFSLFSRSQDGHYYSLAWIMEFVAIVIFTIYINIGKRNENKWNDFHLNSIIHKLCVVWICTVWPTELATADRAGVRAIRVTHDKVSYSRIGCQWPGPNIEKTMCAAR